MATTIPEQLEMKKPRLVKTKIVAGYSLLLWLLGLLGAVTLLCHKLPLMQYVSAAIMFLVMLLGGGFMVPMLKSPWFFVIIVLQPVFPILFLIFRRSWLQFMGMIYHLVMAGLMIAVAGICFYYYYNFDEIEQNDNPGILAILAWMQGGMSIFNAVIFIVFATMLYFDYRKQKEYRLLSGN